MKQIVKEKIQNHRIFAADDGEKKLFGLLSDFDRALTGMPMTAILAGVVQQKLTLIDIKVLGEPFYLSDGASFIYWDDADDENGLKIKSDSSRIKHAFACALALRQEFADLIENFDDFKEFETETQPLETESFH